MSEYEEPLRGIFWGIVGSLGVSASDARAFVEEHQCSALRVATALTTIQSSAHLGGSAEGARRNIAAARARFFLQKAIATHWAWMKRNAITREAVGNVTYREWTIFAAGNPFILLPHGIKLQHLLQRVDDDTSPLAQRYGHALALVAAKNGHAHLAAIYAEFDQHSLDRNDDFLLFDPSLGESADDVFATDEDSETFADAVSRVADDNVGGYLDYWRGRNALVLDEDAVVWMRDVHDAEKRLPVLLASMIALGKTPGDRKKKTRFEFAD